MHVKLQDLTFHVHNACLFLKDADTLARLRTCCNFAQKSSTFFMGGLLELHILYSRNLCIRGVHNSKWFGKCAFISEKSVAVQKELRRKV
jgi:hypothetical protein